MTPQEKRHFGYAANAKMIKLSPGAYKAKLAWCGIREDQAPLHFDMSPEETTIAWERVVKAIAQATYDCCMDGFKQACTAVIECGDEMDNKSLNDCKIRPLDNG